MNTSSVRAMGAYGCNTYGADAYSAACTTSTGTSSSGGSLADTGYDILLPIALGLAVIIASIILLVKTLLRRRVSQK